MSNMSYCRFENTLADLEDCYEAIDDTRFNTNNLSDSERKAYEKLIELCATISEYFSEENTV